MTVKDSYNFIPIALEKFPQTFGIPEQKKTYFPHKLSICASPEKVPTTEFPKEAHFCPEEMSSSRREDFQNWYEKQVEISKNSYNFKEEYIKYCTNDVILLHRGLAKFRHELIQLTGLCPLTLACTLPQYAGIIYRNKFLPKRVEIAKISDKNTGLAYLKQKQSFKALNYFTYLNIQKGCNIRHAGNTSAEYKVGKYSVDGIDPDTNTVYEFMGCMVHACADCYSDKQKVFHPLYQGLKYEDVYAKTQIRLREIKSLGYNIEVKWECQLMNEQLNDPSFSAFIEDRNHLFDPIKSCREAFYGTNVL